MISTDTLKKASLLATTVGAVVLSTLPSLAFSLQDDPDSGWTGQFATTLPDTGINDNTRVAEGFLAANFGAETRSLGFIVPFLWSQLPSSTSYAEMSWDNTLGGWFTSNFDGTSLLVTLANFPERVEAGTIANLTGKEPLPLTAPCAPSTNVSCVPLGPTLPAQTLQPTDLIPFLNLGLFSPDETKTFDIAFQYQFGDNRQGTARPQIVGYTVSAVPEPTTLAGLALAGAGLGLLRRQKQNIEG